MSVLVNMYMKTQVSVLRNSVLKIMVDFEI